MNESNMVMVDESGSGEENLNVTFYNKIVDDVEHEFIKISVPGDTTLVIDEYVTDVYRNRFQRKYRAFKRMEGLTGTPIESWLDIPESMRKQFKQLGFEYVEQVAGSPDSAFARVQGTTGWRNKAQVFLSRGKVPQEDLIKKQQDQIDMLIARLDELTKPKRKSKADTETLKNEDDLNVNAD